MFSRSCLSDLRSRGVRRKFLGLGAIAAALCSIPAQAQWVTAYYINTSFPVSQIPWSKATHVVDMGMVPSDGNGNISGIAGSDADAFTSAAHANGVKALLNVFDNDSNLSAFGSSISNNLNGFVGNIVSFINAHNYDGIDIDWEAGNFGGGDTANYINFIGALRSALGPSKTISMSVYISSGFAQVVQSQNANINQVNMMCYDMDQFNSDLYYNMSVYLAAGDSAHNSCLAIANYFANYMPKSKIGLGLPFYGRIWNGCADSACSDGLHSFGQTWSSQNNSYIPYNNLVASPYWSQPHGWDSTHAASYISYDQPGAANDRFISFTDSQQINALAQMMRSQGFGGLMEYELEYDLIPGQTGDAMHPLATAVWSAVFGSSAPSTNPTTTPTPTVSAPVVSSGSPSGTLPASTSQATMSIATNQAATCKYSTAAGTAYSSMPSTFSSTGGTTHSTAISGFSAGNTYTYYIRCSTSGVADSSDYQVSFSIAKPAISSSVSLAPTSGSGSSQNFAVQVVDTNGASRLTQVDLIAGQIGAPHSCWTEYGPQSQTLYLQDDNNNWMSAALGSSTVLKNSQCSVNPAATTVTTSGAGSQMTVNFAMSFTAAYAGSQPLAIDAADANGWYTGVVSAGSYTVTAPPVVQPAPQPQPGLSISISPGSGAGYMANFVLKATDSNGAGAVQQAVFFIGNNLGGANQCYFDYEASSKTLYLLSADNSHWSPGAIGSMTQLSNGLCMTNLSQVSVSGSGNTLTITIPMGFNTASYRGTQGLMTFGADSAGNVTGWKSAGSWTVR